MEITESEFDTGKLVGHLTLNQRRHFEALDAAFLELLSSPISPKSSELEALAEAVVTLKDGLS